jgi:hypothetical protein
MPNAEDKEGEYTGEANRYSKKMRRFGDKPRFKLGKRLEQSQTTIFSI